MPQYKKNINKPLHSAVPLHASNLDEVSSQVRNSDEVSSRVNSTAGSTRPVNSRIDSTSFGKGVHHPRVLEIMRGLRPNQDISRTCVPFIIFKDKCTNGKCRFIHSTALRDQYQQFVNTREQLARREISQAKRTGCNLPYCAYYVHGCCFRHNCPIPHIMPPPPATLTTVSTSATPITVSTPKTSTTEQETYVPLDTAFLAAARKSPAVSSSRAMQPKGVAKKETSVFIPKLHQRPQYLNDAVKAGTIYSDLFDKLSRALNVNYSKVREIFNKRPPHMKNTALDVKEQMSKKELQQVFKLVETCKKPFDIYTSYLTMEEYCILYEIFRCSNRCNQQGCEHGTTCNRGHHRTNAICHSDFYYSTCDCSRDTDNAIAAIQSKIATLGSKDSEGFQMSNTARREEHKELTRRLELLQLEASLHLNRDSHIRSRPFATSVCLDASSFGYLPTVSPDLSGHDEHIEYRALLSQIERQRLEAREVAWYERLDSVTTPEAYDTLVKGKYVSIDEEGNIITEHKWVHCNKLGAAQKREIPVVKSLEEYISDNDGYYGLPRCYIEQAALYDGTNMSDDVSSTHNWTLEGWTDYLNATYLEQNVEKHFCLIYTFNQFQAISDEQLALYTNVKNPYKSWSTFIRNYETYISAWSQTHRATDFEGDNWKTNKDNVMDIRETGELDQIFSKYLDFQGYFFGITKLEDERVLGQLQDIHRDILKEAPFAVNRFLAQFSKTSMKFKEWIETTYRLEFAMKREHPIASFLDLYNYIRYDIHEIDLSTYLTNPKVACEWKTVILPKNESMKFEEYLAGHKELYSYYNENYYLLPGYSVDKMIQDKINGWGLVSNSKQADIQVFPSLLVLTFGMITVHRDQITRALKIPNTDTMQIKGLGILMHHTLNVSVMKLVNEMIKSTPSRSTIVKYYDDLVASSTTEEFQAFQFTKSYLSWLALFDEQLSEDELASELRRTRRAQMKAKKQALASNNDNSDSDSDDDNNDNTDNNDDSDSDSDDMFNSHKELERSTVAKKESQTYAFDFMTVKFTPIQKAFIVRNPKSSRSAILIGPLPLAPKSKGSSSSDFYKPKLTQVQSLLSGIGVHLKKTKAFAFLSIPVKTNNIDPRLVPTVINVFELSNTTQIYTNVDLHISEEEQQQTEAEFFDDGLDFDYESETELEQELEPDNTSAQVLDEELEIESYSYDIPYIPYDDDIDFDTVDYSNVIDAEQEVTTDVDATDMDDTEGTEVVAKVYDDEEDKSAKWNADNGQVIKSRRDNRKKDTGSTKHSESSKRKEKKGKKDREY